MQFTRSPGMRSGGFTLIELLATSAILSILMSFAVPAFSRWVPGYKLRGAARDLYSDFAMARMTAVNLKGECAVVFDKDNNRYGIWSCGPNRIFENGSGDDAPLKTVELSRYGNGIRYGHGGASAPIGETFGDEITFSWNRLVFDSGGMLKGFPGYVYLQNSRNASYALGVLGSGVISLKRWTGTKWQ